MGSHDLHVEVRGSCIAVTLPGFAYSVTYYTAAGNRRLISEPGVGSIYRGCPHDPLGVLHARLDRSERQGARARVDCVRGSRFGRPPRFKGRPI
jgi:hypothetical protein